MAVSDTIYQLLKFRHAEKAKFPKICWFSWAFSSFCWAFTRLHFFKAKGLWKAFKIVGLHVDEEKCRWAVEQNFQWNF